MNLRTLHFRQLDARTAKKLTPYLDQADGSMARQDYKTAQRVALELQKQRLPGGYALESRAQHGSGRTDRAVDVLKKGLEQFPNQWSLWLELGDMYAAQRRFDEAHEVYDYARTLAGADVPVVDIQRARTMALDNHHLDAIDILVNLETTDPVVKVDGLVAQVEIFNESEGAEYVFARVDRALSLIAKDPEHDYTEEIVRLHTGAGRACRLQNDAEGAKANARRAFDVRRGGFKGTLELLREVRDERSRTSHYYHLLAHGRALDGHVFVTTYGVVANSPEEGLEYCRVVEQDPVAAETLMLQEVEIVEPSPGALLGVYTMSPLYQTE
jgi:tetratricopeptide (TPR) repeat protein